MLADPAQTASTPNRSIPVVPCWRLMPDSKPLYIGLISIHGLIRGENLELGRDADTGGQVQYVLELARALSDHPEVERVDLLTRQILALNMDVQYSEHLEQIAEHAWIVRLPCGPHRYLRKEALWPHVPGFINHALQYFRATNRVPDVFHSHYADSGAVAVRLSRLLDTLLVHTSHSLGRIKRQRLLDHGSTEESIERRYRISQRIAAEESVLDAADMVVASTRQEAEEQYAIYDTAVAKKTVVIPPGVDLDRFRPPRRGDPRPKIADEIDRFLADRKKPMILALQRPDERKNLPTLIRAFAHHPQLRQMANLTLMIGSRDDISDLPKSQRHVFDDMLLQIDRHDLYGSVAYPKSHAAEDVPELYRLAASRRGVFVNPALTEPFGLTLIEAAASGLPMVATADGGPQTIVSLCNNGLLVDPLDVDAVADALNDVLTDRAAWRRYSRSGIRGAHAHFSWPGHVNTYVKRLRRIQRRRQRRMPTLPHTGLVLGDRLMVCDIDNTLVGDRDALAELMVELEKHRGRIVFGVATGRVPPSTLRVLREWDIPMPDVLITSVGSEIYYGHGRIVEDVGWRRTIDRHWDRDALQAALANVPGLRLQPKAHQRPFKLSYYVDPERAPVMAELKRRLRDLGLRASLIYSHEEFLDLLPERASKGRAVRYVAHRWGFPLDHVLVAGDSGNDSDMLRSGVLGVVVGNHQPELRSLRTRDRVYFADNSYARGVLEGATHHDFWPETETE